MDVGPVGRVGWVGWVGVGWVGWVGVGWVGCLKCLKWDVAPVHGRVLENRKPACTTAKTQMALTLTRNGSSAHGMESKKYLMNLLKVALWNFMLT